MSFTEADLLPEGERLNPLLVRRGLATERAVIHEGKLRHVVRFTDAGAEALKHLLGASGGSLPDSREG